MAAGAKTNHSGRGGRRTGNVGLRAPKQPLKNRVDLREVKIEVEAGGKLFFAQVLANLGIGLQQRQKIALAAPGFHRIALDQTVGVFPRRAFLREREQNALRVNKAAEAVEI